MEVSLINIGTSRGIRIPSAVLKDFDTFDTFDTTLNILLARIARKLPVLP